MSSIKKIVAAFVCLCLITAMVLSFAFIADTTDHDCSGEDCEICRTIVSCVQTIRLIGAAYVICAAVVGFVFLLKSVKSASDTWFSAANPVLLGVKLTE